jgi:hypothetical protein
LKLAGGARRSYKFTPLLRRADPAMAYSRNDVWSAEAETLLRRLFAKGLSAGQIAASLQRSRNAVVSKWSRLGLQRLRPRPIDGTAAKARQPKAQRLYKFPSTPAPGFNGVPLLELERAQCRYPLGDDPSAYRFCAAPTVDGSSWCGFHYALCHVEYGGSTAGCNLNLPTATVKMFPLPSITSAS